MVVRVILGLQAIIFLPYGLWCLVNPGLLSGAAGITATSITGTIELQAMYGGLQTAVGVLCALAVFQAAYQRIALVALLFIFAGLAVPRITLGLMHGDFSGYTLFAMSFEGAMVVILLWLLSRGGQRLA